MPRPTPLVHPGLQGSLGSVGQYPSLCTIQDRAEAQDDVGQETGGYDNVAELVDIPCRISVNESNFAGERAQAEMEIVVSSHRCRLQGYFPVIQEKQRALVDGTAYDIRSVEHDSSKTFTRLRLQVVE